MVSSISLDIDFYFYNEGMIIVSFIEKQKDNNASPKNGLDLSFFQ